MYTVHLNDKNDRLVQLIEKVVQGEEVVIVCDDGSSFELLPATSKKPRPKFGSAKGLIWMSDDFDDPIEGFEDYEPRS
ncbi:prevent-host-death protein [[Synechococcus] sp. NIES-970]|nr:prevent-host-death protein [[Synechococcus] sp. NIES-970]